jgi:hypothetical protein
LNAEAKEFVPSFNKQQQVNLTKLFAKSLPLKTNQVDIIEGYHRQPVALKKKKKALPMYYAARRVPQERFQVQRQRQYKSI